MLTKNFALEDFLESEAAVRHGIDMAPTPLVVKGLTLLAVTILQPLRDAEGTPLHISSGYRPPALNRVVGGSDSSQHTAGEAADVKAYTRTALQLCKRVEKMGLPFDQLIHEFGAWMHVSVALGRAPRRQTLTAYKKDGKTVYVPGLIEIPG